MLTTSIFYGLRFRFLCNKVKNIQYNYRQKNVSNRLKYLSMRLFQYVFAPNEEHDLNSFNVLTV